MTYQEFLDAVLDLKITLSDEQLNKFKMYAKLIIKWNEVMDLTAINDELSIIEKHFFDSLLSCKSIKYDNQTILDVGSGAGFPGIVLKIVFPSLHMTLLEPTGKRARFLSEVIKELDLKNIEVVNKRAEDFILDKREAFDLVTARAVSRLNILLELCIPFLKVNGKLIALKGSQAEVEITEAKSSITTLECEIISKTEESLISASEKRTIIIIQKNRPTLLKYPRNYGMIKKKPL